MVFPIRVQSFSTESACGTRCHRIARQKTCQDFVDYATGERYAAKLGNGISAQPPNRWMTPLPSDFHGSREDLFNTRMKAHASKLACCCKNPDAKGCRKQEFAGEKLGEWIEGAGVVTCP